MFTPSKFTPTTWTGTTQQWLGAPDVDGEGLAVAKLQAQNAKDLQGNQLTYQGGQAAADRAFQGGQAAANRGLQQQLGMAPWAFKDQVFNTVSPLLKGLMGQAQGQAGLVGGQNGPSPQIDAGPVWSPQMIDQQVNAAKAGTAQKAQTQMTANQRNTAASGFGSRSPLLAALNSGVGMQAQAAGTDAERNIRFGAAQGNAQQVLAGQQAQEGQWRDQQDADIRRRQANHQYVTSIAGLLAGMM